MKRMFQVNAGRQREFFVRAESDYDAAQKAAEILKLGTYARKHHEKPNAWEVYKHFRGEDWAQSIFLVVRPVAQPSGDVEGRFEFFDGSFFSLNVKNDVVTVTISEGEQTSQLLLALNPETDDKKLAAFRRLCLALKPAEAAKP